MISAYNSIKLYYLAVDTSILHAHSLPNKHCYGVYGREKIIYFQLVMLTKIKIDNKLYTLYFFVLGTAFGRIHCCRSR